MKSGVGRGRINSPWFYNVYINDLIVKLRKGGYGCYNGFIFAGCLFFAYDILLLSASILHLQRMLELVVIMVMNMIYCSTKKVVFAASWFKCQCFIASIDVK